MPRRPNTPAQPERAPVRDMMVRSLPQDVHRALRIEAARREISLERYVRELLTEVATRLATPGPATGYRYTLDIHANVTDEQADKLLQDLIWSVERHQLQAAAGMKAIDDNGNPTD